MLMIACKMRNCGFLIFNEELEDFSDFEGQNEDQEDNSFSVSLDEGDDFEFDEDDKFEDFLMKDDKNSETQRETSNW